MFGIGFWGIFFPKNYHILGVSAWVS